MKLKQVKLGVVIATALGRIDLLFDRSLRSVLEQTRKPDFILIVDDNVDESVCLKITQRLQSADFDSVYYIRNSRTKGMSGTGAWNSGLDWYSDKLSQNDYIAILDDDDCWCSEYLAQCMACVKVGVAYPNEVVAFLKRSDCRYVSSFSKDDLNVDAFLAGNPGIQGSNMFFRFGAIQQITGFDEELASCADRDLLIRFFLEFPVETISIVPKLLVHHYAWSGSVTFDELKKRKGLDELYRKHIALYSYSVLEKSLNRSEYLFRYKNGKNICKLWNLVHHCADEEKIVIGVAVHNNKESIKNCIRSILFQKNMRSHVWIFIADDGSVDDWQEEIQEYLQDERVIYWHVCFSNVSKVRNYINHFIKKYFGMVKLIGRLDADDFFACNDVLSQIEAVKDATDADVVFAGNYLKENGKILSRINKAVEDLKNPEYLLGRLYRMANGDSEAELPSCNTFMTVRSLEEYPETPSAEDHFVMVRLLLNRKKLKLAFAEHILLTVYNLNGKMTKNNKLRQVYIQTRWELYEEARNICKMTKEE